MTLSTYNPYLINTYKMGNNNKKRKELTMMNCDNNNFSEDNNVSDISLLLQQNDEKKKQSIRKNLIIEITPNFNRGIIQTLHVSGEPMQVGIMYDRKSALVQFQIDNESQKIKDKTVQVFMFRNFDSCLFAKLFLDLKSEITDNKDMKNMFNSLKPLYSRYLIPFINEKYDFQASSDVSTNYLRLTGWKIMDVDNELLFLLIQRVFYSDTTRLLVGRSYGLQLCSERGLQCLNRYNEDLEKQKHYVHNKI